MLSAAVIIVLLVALLIVQSVLLWWCIRSVASLSNQIDTQVNKQKETNRLLRKVVFEDTELEDAASDEESR